MKKTAYFNSEDIKGWPRPEELRPYFLAPPGQEWFDTGGNDGALLTAEGLYGTENEDGLTGNRVDVDLYLYGQPGLGVMLLYNKYGGGYGEHFNSKGDMSRLKEIVRDVQGGAIPVGLLVPFPAAFEAVKEFIETDGELPKSIEWIADKDLPPDTLPDPAEEWLARQRHSETRSR
ncbi:MAG: Imm1 family immunity protein [Pseudomonadota bacterium]